MLKESYYAAMRGLAGVQTRWPLGQSIWSDDWDICIILDSCRVDLLRQFWTGVDAKWSVGSVTTEWLANTFNRRQRFDASNIALVSATPHTQTVFGNRDVLTNQGDVSIPFPDANVVDRSDFDGYYEVWRSHASVKDAVPPWTMRAATIEAYQRHDRVVSHWLQPHEPFIASDAAVTGGSATDKNVWRDLKDGALDERAVWQSYAATLEMALNELGSLLNEVDADVLITADHGNAFGELGVYGHPYGFPHPVVRKVPWLKETATKNRDPDLENVLDTTGSSTDIQDQLSALGYR